jgi:Fe-S-cluster containining protein
MGEVSVSRRDRDTIVTVQDRFRAMDREWRELLDLNSQLPVIDGRPKVDVACAKGCAACCTYVVDALEAEAITIATAIEAQAGPRLKAEVLGRLLAWEHEFSLWLKSNPRPEPVLVKGKRNGQPTFEDNPKHKAWRTRWQIKRKACPFLNLDDYSCGIYEVRPTTCRAHHAAYLPPDAPPHVRQPPDGCFSTPEDITRRTFTTIWQINNQIGEIWSFNLAKTLGQRGLPWEPGLVLPMAVLKAGRQRFGWPGPRPAGAVPTLDHARKP